MTGDSHILFQPITALTAVGPFRSLAWRQAIVWTYRPMVEVYGSFPIFQVLWRNVSRLCRRPTIFDRCDPTGSNVSTFSNEKVRRARGTRVPSEAVVAWSLIGKYVDQTLREQNVRKSGSFILLDCRDAWLDRETILIVMSNESRVNCINRLDRSKRWNERIYCVFNEIAASRNPSSLSRLRATFQFLRLFRGLLIAEVLVCIYVYVCIYRMSQNSFNTRK